MADPRVLAFLGGAKDQWEDDMTDANKADRAALSTDPEKKAARQAKIGELWGAADSNKDGFLTEAEFVNFATSHFDHEDSLYGKHRLPVDTLKSAWSVAHAVYGEADKPGITIQ
tara:strand:- start:139 stop:480 length:342 start_codon:yes stop_codon:yes gene_type:complete